MKAFVSWSGGKDCMLAMHTFRRDPYNEVVSLLNMCNEDGEKSRSHGVSADLIKLQALCMNLPIEQEIIDENGYEFNFKNAAQKLIDRGATAGVFGDIYLIEHRVWIERVCNDLGILAIFPLWGKDTTFLLKEFVDLGFKTITVSVMENMLPASWLGREIDYKFIDDILKLSNIDPCAENGEYHTFVYDGPSFISPVSIQKGKTYQQDNHYFMELLQNKTL